MKILQVANYFSPVHGGSAEVPYRLSLELARRGHAVTIYTSDYKLSRDWLLTSQKLDIKVFLFKTWLNCAGLQFTPSILKQNQQNLKQFDIIHLHNHRTFQNTVIANYARKSSIPYIVQAHGSAGTYFQKGRLKRIYDRIWGNQILASASKVISVSAIENEQYILLGVKPENIANIPNGIDLSEYQNLPPRGQFRQRYGLTGNDKVILYLGRIHRTKGIDLLIRAFAKISNNIPELKLVIAGPDDGYLSEIRRLVQYLQISSKVFFTGPLNGRDKLAAYVDSDIFVNVRSDEIFGLVFLEACACGIPVICSTGCGIADIIDHKVGFAVHNEESLIKAIMDILSNPDLSRKYSETGKIMVRESHSWDKIAERLERVYADCLRNL